MFKEKSISCYLALSDHWDALSASNSLTTVILREGVKYGFCPPRPPPPFTDFSQKVFLSKMLKMVFLDKRHLLLTSFPNYGQNPAQYFNPFWKKNNLFSSSMRFSVSNDTTAKKVIVLTKKKKQTYLTIWDAYHCSKYEERYFSFFSAVCEDIFNETGCPPPCSHWEYRWAKVVIMEIMRIMKILSHPLFSNIFQ